MGLHISDRDLLLTWLAKYSYSYDTSRTLTLSSGKATNEYIDCKKTLCYPRALKIAIELIHDKTNPQCVTDIDNYMYPVGGSIPMYCSAVGGLGLGADMISIAMSTRYDYRWFSVRKEQKAWGTQQLIEGQLNHKASVLIVDDVITTGASVIKAISKVQKEVEADVCAVVGLVDRQDGGLERIKGVVGKNCDVSAIFTLDEIRVAAENVKK